MTPIMVCHFTAITLTSVGPYEFYPKLLDLTESAQERIKTYSFIYSLPGGAKHRYYDSTFRKLSISKSVDLPSDIKRGATYTIRWKVGALF